MRKKFFGSCRRCSSRQVGAYWWVEGTMEGTMLPCCHGTAYPHPRKVERWSEDGRGLVNGVFAGRDILLCSLLL